MRELGYVLHKSRSGMIIVKVSEHVRRLPPLGVDVFDKDRSKIGKLFDIVGPVDSPYAVIKPQQQIELESGAKIYFSYPKPRKARRKGGKKRGRKGGRR